MEQLAFDGLSIAADTPDAHVSNLILTWRGKSRSRKPSTEIVPYLLKAITLAKEESKSLIMRFERLDYFNSGTVTAIIQSIHAARAHGVKMRIVYDDAVEWQRLSFEPMRVFTSDELFSLAISGEA